MRATGGSAPGETSTRSSPACSAAAKGSARERTPSWPPSSAITSRLLARISWLTRESLAISVTPYRWQYHSKTGAESTRGFISLSQDWAESRLLAVLEGFADVNRPYISGIIKVGDGPGDLDRPY